MAIKTFRLMLYKSASLFFAVDVDNVASRYGGPKIPGVPPWTEFGQVEEVFIDIEKEEESL